MLCYARLGHRLHRALGEAGRAQPRRLRRLARRDAQLAEHAPQRLALLPDLGRAPPPPARNEATATAFEASALQSEYSNAEAAVASGAGTMASLWRRPRVAYRLLVTRVPHPSFSLTCASQLLSWAADIAPASILP